MNGPEQTDFRYRFFSLLYYSGHWTTNNPRLIGCDSFDEWNGVGVCGAIGPTGVCVLD